MSKVKRRVNFFISYTGSDENIASWIAWELDRARFTYVMQAEHFVPGSRFISEMRRGLGDADHLIAVLSPAYFKSSFGSLEIQSAVAQDPLGEKRRVIPVRVQKCKIPTIFRDLVYIDLVGRTEEESRRALIAGVSAARVGTHAESRSVRSRPTFPMSTSRADAGAEPPIASTRNASSAVVRIQFFACDVGRGLDLRGQYQKIKKVLSVSRFSNRFKLKGEFDVTDINLFAKLNSYRPHVVHISGNQSGGDVLLPSSKGGEVVVSDMALAGLLSSLGRDVRLAIIDTCWSYACAKRVSEVVACSIGVDDDIGDDEATRFYEVFYQAVTAGQSIQDAYGQAVTSLRFMHIPKKGIPKLCVRKGEDASKISLVE